MKYSSQGKQIRLDIFSGTLEKSLDPSNRWYKLANSMPWDKIERIYNKSLRNKHSKRGNKTARMVIGALIIKHKMNLSDEETIRLIAENPYMQYFIGLEEFTGKPIFDSSLFVYVRKRINVESINEMSLAVMEAEYGKGGESVGCGGNEGDNTDKKKDEQRNENDCSVDEEGILHKGSIKIDATCCDVEVKYPTDLDLFNDAREVSERLIDKLCRLSGSPKPRTYRKRARHHYLQVVKKRRKSKQLIRKGVKQQHVYPGRNIRSIIDVISKCSTSTFDSLTKKERQGIGTIIKVYRQQKGMYDTHTHQCPDRIISVFQPHVRPIVRGKSKSKVEFGSKIGVSVVGGYTFIDHFSWDAYSESEDLARHIKACRKRFGYLPTTCYVDKIYMNRENRALLKHYHIRAAGKPPGRPAKEMQTEAWRKEAAKGEGKRNEAESTFGTYKRIYRVNNVWAILPDTSDVWTAACFLVKNVKKLLKGLLFVLFEKRLLEVKKIFSAINRELLFSLRAIA